MHYPGTLWGMQQMFGRDYTAISRVHRTMLHWLDARHRGKVVGNIEWYRTHFDSYNTARGRIWGRRSTWGCGDGTTIAGATFRFFDAGPSTWSLRIPSPCNFLARFLSAAAWISAWVRSASLVAGCRRVQFCANSLQVSSHGLFEHLQFVMLNVLHLAFGHAAQDIVEPAKVHTKYVWGGMSATRIDMAAVKPEK